MSLYSVFQESFSIHGWFKQHSRMVHMKEGLFLIFLLRTFQHVVVFILLTQFCGGQCQPVMTMVGDDVVLPYQLEPPADATQMILEWGRTDLNPRFVFVWHNGQELLEDQNKAYKGRTSLSIDKMKYGDVSLKLSKVKISDEGTYRCYIPTLNKEYFIELLVGVVSSPGINLAGIDRSSSSRVILQCESKGWYPEPEVFWLDGEGNLLSAGPTETVRGPDDLYTVSSRVTVEKRHNNNFTCRVQQNNINQTRETHIIVSDDFFVAPSSCAASVTTSVLFGFMFILAVVIFVFKWRLNKNEQQLLNKGEESKKQLMTENKKMIDFEKKKAKLNEKLQKKAEEEKNMKELIDTLQKQNKELLNQKGQISIQVGKTEELMEKNETKVNSVEKEISEKGDQTASRAQGYLKLKEIIKEANWNLEERKKEQQTLGLTIDKVLTMTKSEVNRMTERNKQLQSDREKINEQLEEINRQQDEIGKKKGKKEDNKTKQILFS